MQPFYQKPTLAEKIAGAVIFFSLGVLAYFSLANSVPFPV